MSNMTQSITFRAVDQVSRTTDRMSRSMQSMTRVVRLAGAALAGGVIFRGIQRIVQEGSSIETVTTQFETLTGSVENATRLVKDMQDFAATTPLQFDTLAQGTQRLLAFGIAQEDIIATMRTLGDAALGDADKLDSLTRAFGKVNARGKASMEEINMVIDAGVPIMDALNEQFGTTTEELSEMIRTGQVTSDVFNEAFRSMTSEGGQFHNGMQRQSQTTAGLISTLKDNIALTAGTIGQALLPTVKTLTENLIAVTGRIREWVSGNQELIQTKVENFITAIGNAVRFVVRLWDSGFLPALLAGITAFKVLTGLMAAYKAVAAAVKIVQIALNVAMTANPIGLIIAAIAALIGLGVLLIKNWDKVKAFFGRLWDGIKEGFSKFWNWIKGIFQGIWDWITGIIDKIKEIGQKIGGFIEKINPFDAESREARQDRREERRAARAERRGEDATISPNEGVVVSQSLSEQRSTVDVNFNGAPSNVDIRQRGQAPGVNMNTGYRSGGS